MEDSECNRSYSEAVAMSAKEVDYTSALRQVRSGELSKAAAAARLRVNPRHVRRLYAAWLVTGDACLAHKGRGKSGNRAKTEEQSRFIAWYEGLSAAGKYAPTHAAEQYGEETGRAISKETARRWLSAAGLWNSRKAKAAKIHPLQRAVPAAALTSRDERESLRYAPPMEYINVFSQSSESTAAGIPI